MRTTLLLLLVTTACATTEKADSFELTGIPVDANSLQDVMHDVQAAAHTTRDHVGTVNIVAKPFPCQVTQGRRCGGETLDMQDGSKEVTVALISDAQPFYATVTDGDLHCTNIVHELVHVYFGDADHANPKLWYGPEGLVRKLLSSYGCDNIPTAN